MEKPGKYLVIHQGALGDLILTLAALDRTPGETPAGVFCRSAFVPLLRHLSAARDVFNVEDPDFSQLFANVASPRYVSLFKQYDRILLFSNASELCQHLASLTKARVHRVPPRPKPDRRIHMVDFLTGRLQQIFAEKRQAEGTTRFNLSHDPAVGGHILIHPGSGSPRKNWPIENFVQLSRMIDPENNRVRWIVGPAEAEKAGELTRLGINSGAICSNDDLVAFCMRLAASRLFIGNDSGLSHLAAYTGTPVFAVFGPSDPLRWKPVGPGVAIAAPETSCTPCFEKPDPACEQRDCFSGITPRRIFTFLKNSYQI